MVDQCKRFAYSEDMSGMTLRRQRERLGYSQAQLAKLLGVHVRTISKWERGVHRIPDAVLLLLKQIKPRKRGQ
jgi:DNA-binding transcriptional regulator YiaG